jgi:hypothetical protein
VRNSINRVENVKDISHNMLFKKDPNKFNNLEDFGMDQENLSSKLIFNCFLILFLKILISYDDKVNKFEEANADSGKNNDEGVVDVATKILLYIKVSFYQIVYLHSTKILIIVAAIVALNLETMIGGLIFIIIFICLIEGKNNNWKYAFFPLFFFSMIVLNFIYLCNLKIFRKWMTKDYEWLGIYNPNNSEEVFSQIFPYLLIMTISYFARISQKYKSYYKDKASLQMTESLSKEDNSHDEDQSNLVSNEGHKFNVNLTQVSENEAHSPFEASIIENLSELWYSFDYIWYLYGFYVILFLILIISFIKINVVSLVFIAFVGMQSFNV